MSRWSDLAEWVGPTPNQGGPMSRHDGVVLHIAAGYYEGTISWQRNPAADVSSHFIVSKSGRIAQMVDTDVTAWTQRDGNGEWLSVENEGFLPDGLTAAQVEANARILARAHLAYGVPLQVTDTPTRRGLGHHSMGAENGFNWGHPACPGPAIKAQKSAIVTRAVAIVNGDDIMAALTDEEQRLLARRVQDLWYSVGRYVPMLDQPNKTEAITYAWPRLVALVQEVARRVDIDDAEVARIAAAVPQPPDAGEIVQGVLDGLGHRPVADVAAALRAVYEGRPEQLAQLVVLLGGTGTGSSE